MHFKESNHIIKNEDGFTLLEVLIAIAILSVLMVSIYSIMDSSANTKDRIVKEDAELLMFETALARIESDIEFIHSPLYYEATKKASDLFELKAKSKAKGSTPTNPTSNNDDVYAQTSLYDNNKFFSGLSESGKPIPILGNDEKGSFTFLSSSGRRLFKNSKQSNLQWIRYQVVNNEEAENKEAPYALTRTVINQQIFTRELDWDGAKEYMILKNLKDFKFMFWDRTKEKYVDQIRLLSKDEKETPRLIKVVVNSVLPDGSEIETERVFRPLWPFVDVKKNLEEKYDFSKKSGPTGGLSGGGNK